MHSAPLSSDRRTGFWTATAILIVSCALAPATLPRLDLCLFHRLTHLPCPGCGLTRAVCCISHGDFAGAWAYNPFGYVAYAAILALLLRPVFFRLTPGLEERILRWRALGAVVIVTASAMMIFNFWRIARILFPPA